MGFLAKEDAMEVPQLDFLWQYVEYWASVDPDFPAVRFGERTITAMELDATIQRCAKAFVDIGIQKGDQILTILPSCPEYAVIMVAAQRMGAIVVPMDVRYRAADYRQFLGYVDPKLLILTERFEDYSIAEIMKELGSDLASDVPLFVVGPCTIGVSFDTLLAEAVDSDVNLAVVQSHVAPDDGALIIFTGGTTGMPKAALLSHRNIARASFLEHARIARSLAEQGVSGRSKLLQNLPPSHVGGSVEIMGTGLVGGWEMIMQEQWHPYAVLKTIQEERLCLIGGVPTMYAILLSLPDLASYDRSSLKVAITSGERVTLELLQGMREHLCQAILNAYGSTEFGPEVTFTELSDPIEKLADGYVGKPLPGQELLIVDEDGNPLPPGHIGELLVRGDCTIQGYFNMPEEDRATFLAGGWCKSGDLGYLTEDGGLYLKGRLKHIIRFGSYTVLPTEIEQVVQEHPSVALVAAIGVPHAIYGEVIWLVVVPQAGETILEDELIGLCAQQLADFKVPKRVIVQEALPMTRIGKVDRPVLRSQILETVTPSIPGR